MTLRAQTGQGYIVAGPGIGCTRATSGGVGIVFGPVVFVAALWSRVGSVQALRTDPKLKTRRDEQQTVRIVNLDL